MILFSLKLTYLKHLSERNYRHVNILGGCTHRRKGSDIIILLSNIQEWAYNNYRKSAILKIFIFLLFSNWSYRHSPLVQNFISTDARHLNRDAHPDNRRYKGPCSFTSKHNSLQQTDCSQLGLDLNLFLIWKYE